MKDRCPFLRARLERFAKIQSVFRHDTSYVSAFRFCRSFYSFIEPNEKKMQRKKKKQKIKGGEEGEKETKAGSKKKCMWKKQYRRVSLRNAAFAASAFVSAFFRVVHQSKKAGKNANGRDQMTTQRQTLLSKRFYISIHIHRPPLHLYDLSARATRNKSPRRMDY